MTSRKNTAPIAILLLRLLIFILLLVSLIALVTDNKTVQFLSPDGKFRVKDYHAYRYVLSVAAIGCVYMLLQIPFAAINVGGGTISRGNDHMMLSLIFADMVVSLFLMSGVGAGFGITVDMKARYNKFFRSLFGDYDTPEIDRLQSDTNKFFDVAYVSTGFLLIATLCMVIIMFISVSALAKK
ncbi:CASP-like protein 4D1 [Typha latifolia]|uniref:CASP-like protein 4D1 n=1 Tax=Typha latifolia TaxID=4733 RepID=UPI003C2CB54B